MSTVPLTFLFTDLENSTARWEKNPSAMQLAAARHDALLQAVIAEHSGRVVKATGDGFHAVFESPSSGVAAALSGQLRLAAEDWPAETGPLSVRMGLHTGESQARDGDYFGPEVNLAARLMGLGHGGQVLLSEAAATLVRKSLPPDCTLADLGEHRLKGIAPVERIFQLCHPGLASSFPPLKSLLTFKHNLPAQPASFIGRAQELGEIKRLLKSAPILTLLGPGGTGKTRLMLQAAEELIEAYPDGVWLVELASLTDPELVPERVAAALNVQEQPGRPVLDTLVEYLRRKELLLLLDNVEHLLRPSAELAEHLLRFCLKLKILVTGREALFVAGETTLQIPSLSLPGTKGDLSLEAIRTSEGVQLFLERAQAVRPDFCLTPDNAAAISEIVLRLDGIPLALELAAARLRMLTVEQIAARLNDRFRLLTGGRRTALPRQQTLLALIDWSWILLEEPERVLLRRLSVFSGGWTLAAAQAVTGYDPLDEFSVFDLLEQLINKSLVTVQVLGEGETRYGMLETIRQYAQGKLFEAGEGVALRDRHVDTFISLVEVFNQEGLGSDFYTWLKRFAEEADNLRAVWDWIAEDRPGLTLHFTGMLLQFEVNWMPYREARAWLEAAVGEARSLLAQNPAAVDRLDYIRALQSLGWLLLTHGDMLAGHPLLDESIRLAREQGELSFLAIALGMKAQAMGASVTREIIARLEEVIERCRQNAMEMELIFTLYAVGEAYLVNGELEKGRAAISEVLERIQRYDLHFIQGWVYYPLAIQARMDGNLRAAEKYYLMAIAATEKLGNQRLAASGQSELAHMYRQAGRLEEASTIYRQTILAWQEQGHQAAVAHQLECFAYLAVTGGKYEYAARLLGAAESGRSRLKLPSTDQVEIQEKEQALKTLGAELGVDERRRLMDVGKMMDLDEAVAFALDNG